LVLADRLPERLALARVLDRALETRAHHTAGTGRHSEPALVEAVHRDLEPLSLLADQILGRNLSVLEEELSRRARPDPELVLGVGGREPSRPALDDERRNPLVPRGRISLREDERVVGDVRVRDPVLRPVED